QLPAAAVPAALNPPVPPEAAPPAARPPAAAPEYPELDAAAFRKFLDSAPYGRGVKPLIELLARHAPEPERRVALGVLTRLMPHIVSDSVKAGTRSRASLTPMLESLAPDRHQIALHDGPVIVEERSLFRKGRVYLLPDDPAFYRQRGVPVPSLEAFSRESASDKETDGPWGRVRVYADGSERLLRSPEAMAGALLGGLLMLDARLRGWDDAFHSGLRAEAAEFRFYRRMQRDTGTEPRLDRALKTRYHEWQERPEDYIDLMLHSHLGRSSRQELEVLEAAGVAKAGEAEGAAADPEAARLPPGDSPAARAWLEAERRARETR
ncbi:MAG: hypothetical protein ABII00_13680, partial [Elusimicrobiota bacterium]